MISRPRPRFITDPIPAGFCALPIAIAIWTPGHIHPSGNPATAIAPDNLPSSIRAKRLVKILLRPDDQFARTNGILDNRSRLGRDIYRLRWRRLIISHALGWALHISGASGKRQE